MKRFFLFLYIWIRAGIKPKEIEKIYSRICCMDFYDLVDVGPGYLKCYGEYLYYRPKVLGPAFMINEAVPRGIVVRDAVQHECNTQCPKECAGFREIYRYGKFIRKFDWVYALVNLNNWLIEHHAYSVREKELHDITKI